MAETEWNQYGKESGNPKCANCMVHSGYEASAVDYTFSSLRGLWDTAKASFSWKYDDEESLTLLNETVGTAPSRTPLVQIEDKPELAGDAQLTGGNRTHRSLRGRFRFA